MNIEPSAVDLFSLLDFILIVYKFNVKATTNVTLKACSFAKIEALYLIEKSVGNVETIILCVQTQNCSL